MANHTAEYYREYYKKNKEKLQAYKHEYSAKVVYKKYKKICAFVDRDKAKQFENKLIKDKLSITDFVNNAIDEYIKKD